MLHAVTIAPAPTANGTSLSRFCPRALLGFVVQKQLCSVHAEAASGAGFASLTLN